jgi:hypothetical protein
MHCLLLSAPGTGMAITVHVLGQYQSRLAFAVYGVNSSWLLTQTQCLASALRSQFQRLFFLANMTLLGAYEVGLIFNASHGRSLNTTTVVLDCLVHPFLALWDTQSVKAVFHLHDSHTCFQL